MHNIRIKYVLLLLFLTGGVAISSYAQGPLEGIRICLDAGHGGHDGDDRPTALNIGKTYYESDANWEAIGYLDSLLTKLGAITKNTKVTNDPESPLRQPTLSDRVLVANQFGADYFHSFHTNGSSNQSVNTTIVIYAGSANGVPDVQEAYDMAEIMSPQLFKYMRTTAERSWADIPLTGYTNGLGVLNNLIMPGTLSEASFHSNWDEGRRLMNSKYRKAAAWAIAKSFLEFYQEPELAFGETGGLVRERIENPNDPLDTIGNPINGLIATLSPGTVNEQVYEGDHFKNGFYFFDRLEPGVYDIKIDATGFEPDTITVTVMAGQYTETDVTLSAISDGLPAGTPTLQYIGNPGTGTGVEVTWEAPDEQPLGYRLYYTLDNTMATWALAADERMIAGDVTSFVLDSRWDFEVVPDDPIYHFKLSAISQTEVEGAASDVYSRSSGADSDKVLIVDGFDRTDGGYSSTTHDFAADYFVGINSTKYTNVSTAANEAVVSGEVLLSDYKMVAWFLGDESVSDETFSDEEQALIKPYLENGGKLIVCGSDIANDLENNGSATDQAFANDYLKIGYLGDGTSTDSPATGVSGTLFEGISAVFGSAYTVDSPDDISTSGGSEYIFEYATSGTHGGVAYKGTFGSGTTEGGLVSLTFPIETGFISNVKLILEASMDYLDVGGIFPIPPGLPTLHWVQATADGLNASWAANSEDNLIGYRIYYAVDDEFTDWQLMVDENTLDINATEITVPYDDYLVLPTGFSPQHYKLTAVSEGGYESEPSDIYSTQYVDSDISALIVDAFDRTGSYIFPTHSFSASYFSSLKAAETMIIHTAANESVVDGKVSLGDYDMVIWVVGDESTGSVSFSSSEQALIQAYLEKGGRFFTSGSEIGYDLYHNGSGADKSFYSDYFKATYITDGGSMSSPATGVVGTDFEGVEIEFGIVYNEDYADEITSFKGSDTLLVYPNGNYGGVGFRGLFGESTVPGVVVYFSFPLETALQDDMNDAMVAIYDYLALNNDTPPGAEKDVLDAEVSGVTTLDVLINDWDFQDDIDPSTLMIVDHPSKGSATVVDGKIQYTAASEVYTRDTLTYTVTDVGGLISNIALVEVVVNYEPVTNEDDIAVNEGVETVIDVLANDTDGDEDIDSSALQIISGPTNGSAMIVDGKVKYTPETGSAVYDSFTYQVTDQMGYSSNVSTVAIKINRTPIANDDQMVGVKGEKVKFYVLTNDEDANNDIDRGSIQVISQASHGVATAVYGSIEYTTEGYFNSDSFTYQVTDRSGLVSNVATVTITVDGVLAIDDESYEIMLHPNPAFEVVTLKFNGNLKESSFWTIYLIDTSGKELRTITYTLTDKKRGVQLDVEGMTAGIYFVKVISDSGEYMTRMIKR